MKWSDFSHEVTVWITQQRGFIPIYWVRNNFSGWQHSTHLCCHDSQVFVGVNMYEIISLWCEGVNSAKHSVLPEEFKGRKTVISITPCLKTDSRPVQTATETEQTIRKYWELTKQVKKQRSVKQQKSPSVLTANSSHTNAGGQTRIMTEEKPRSPDRESRYSPDGALERSW